MIAAWERTAKQISGPGACGENGLREQIADDHIPNKAPVHREKGDERKAVHVVAWLNRESNKDQILV